MHRSPLTGVKMCKFYAHIALYADTDAINCKLCECQLWAYDIYVCKSQTCSLGYFYEIILSGCGHRNINKVHDLSKFIGPIIMQCSGKKQRSLHGNSQKSLGLASSGGRGDTPAA